MKTLSFIKIFTYITCLWVAYLAHSQPVTPFTIETITIQTPSHTLKNILKAPLQKYIGSRYSQKKTDQIRQTITRHLLKNKYRNSIIQNASVKFKDNKALITFTIQHPYQYHFIIHGNQQIKKPQLLKAIKLDKLSNEFDFIKTITDRVINYYLSFGFKDIEVQSKVNDDKDNKIKKVHLSIKEGSQFIIKKIQIQGSIQKNKELYKSLFLKNITLPLKLNLYSAKDLDLALDKLLSHLRRSGFLNANIYYKDIRFLNNSVLIKIFINENIPLTIKDIIITGNKIFSKKEILDFIEVKKGNILDLDIWNAGIAKLERAYLNKGFFNVQLLNRDQMLDISNSLKDVLIHIKIKEGFPAFIHDIQVKGNKKVKSKSIILASRLKKGTAVTIKDILKAKDFIDDLAIFFNVNIQVNTPRKNKSVILIEVEEKNFKFLKIGFGASTRNLFSIRAPIEYIEKRFLGNDHNEVSLRAQAGSNIPLINAFLDDLSKNQHQPLSILRNRFFEYDLFGSYEKHYLFNTQFSSQISYSLSDNIFTLNQPLSQMIENNRIEWEKSHKFTFGLEKKFSLRTQLNIKILELNLNESRTIQNLSTTLNKNHQILSLTGLSLLIDQRNHILYPTSGQMLITSLDYSGPIIRTDPAIHFLRAESKYRFYIPFKNIVWAQSINGGYAHRFASKGIPLSQLFILGGINSLRGFDGDNDRVPNQSELRIEQATDIVSKSSAYFLIKSEIRFPIYKNILRGGLFYDGGSVYLTNTPMKLPYRHSAGVSLHYQFLVVDFSFKLNPSSYYTATGQKVEESPFHIGLYIGAF